MGRNVGRKLAAKMFKEARQLTTVERLALAKLLLESVLAGEPDDETNWLAMSLDTFQRDWDNAEDAIYDNWRELYGVSVGEPGVDLDRLRELLSGQLE
jgi:hypothetical protein